MSEEPFLLPGAGGGVSGGGEVEEAGLEGIVVVVLVGGGYRCVGFWAECWWRGRLLGLIGWDSGGWVGSKVDGG